MDNFDRAKRREYMRNYYAKHRGAWNAYQREWYNKNREKKEEQRRKAEKEKLVELICEAHKCIDPSDTVKDYCLYVANHLMANGVSIKV